MHILECITFLLTSRPLQRPTTEAYAEAGHSYLNGPRVDSDSSGNAVLGAG